MIKAFWLLLLLGVIPFILGLPWIQVVNPKHKYSFAYASGFFVGLALYEIVALPVTLNYGEFSRIVWIYSTVLVLACGLSVWCVIRNRKRIEKPVAFHWTEWIYILAFVVILAIQIYRGFTYDLTYMSLDDAMYITYSADAFSRNGEMSIDAYTGAGRVVYIKYAFPAWNIYPAYLATISGLSVTTIAHSVQYIQLLLLAYNTYWFVAGEIIKERDNQLIFMLIIALFYWFGYHSHYSLTFRLLGPNYQGKAVLAVSLTPLILTVLIKKLEMKYSGLFGVYLLLVSLAGVSLTFWGAGTILVIVLVPLLLSLFRRERCWKQLIYAPWACLVPLFSAGYYLMDKFGV